MSITSVNEYLNGLDDNKKKAVEEFLLFMQKEYPQVKPKISFSMPMWLTGRKMNDGYVAVSVAQKHVTIHFSDEERIVTLKNELPYCKVGKRCINIKYGDADSFQIVKRNVKDHLDSLLAGK